MRIAPSVKSSCAGTITVVRNPMMKRRTMDLGDQRKAMLAGRINQRMGGKRLIHEGCAGRTNRNPPPNMSALIILAPNSSAMRCPSPVLVGLMGSVADTGGGGSGG